MPAAPAPATVLISGVNGYVGCWVANAFLEHGYSVRGTVRSIERAGQHLKELFAKYDDKFELVEVIDITVPGAFDEAVKGVDIVAHTAAPADFSSTNPSDIIDPAVQGTVSILDSILVHAPSVKRFILTSSCVSIWTMFIDAPREFTEADWNDQAVNLVNEKGGEAGGMTIYSAAKTLSERAAWEFVEKNKPSWDMATINPPFLFGPPLQEVQSVDKLNLSMKVLYDIVTGKLPDHQYDKMSLNFVHARDVAEIHVRAAELPQAGGTRCLITAGAYFPQDILDIANSLDPKPCEGVPKRKPGATKGRKHRITYSMEQFGRVYGFKMHTAAETIADSLHDFKARGWIQ
ncbi:D-lactaldehyde dehydrogenase [Vararia minispora EC-137]|uniref:D-lactaldehyde dehydrogenase n=1 Tax=Vararia minispora EC-137 TaxID=1314806 RepID=A0ACB8QXR6_9AGAM|nr:D-lactaldehyde dehydrogenase [Vararia minispora EC-137]